MELRSADTADHTAAMELTESEIVYLANSIGRGMGVLKLSATERARLCNNMIRGLKTLAATDGHANPFIPLFEQLSRSTSIGVEEMQRLDGPAHPLTRQLTNQPMSELPQATALQCLAIGAQLFINTWLKTESYDQDFSHGVQQLYVSKRHEWRQFRRIDLVDATAVKNNADKSISATVNQFATRLHSFLRTGLPDVASLRFGMLTHCKQEGPPIRNVADQIGDPAVVKNGAAAPKAAVKESDDTTPDFDLFGKQIQRNLHPDLVDGNRLPIHWSRLNVREFKTVTGRLNKALFNKARDPVSQRKRYHAAARYVSIFCGLSLKTALRSTVMSCQFRG